MDMEEDYFNYEMPEWDRNRFSSEDDEGEAWKMQPQWDAAEKLYDHCREIFKLCHLLNESISGEWAESSRSMIMANTSIIGAKIVGAESGNLYILRMENAAIIRLNMIELRHQLIMLNELQPDLNPYCQHILAEIEKFKQQFKVWISFFKNDEFEDDWGLF